MKKALIGITILIAIILISCDKPSKIYFERYTEELNGITVNNFKIFKTDYTKVNSALSIIPFSSKKLANTTLVKKINIKSMENKNYTFYLYSNNTVKYVVDKKTYYSNYNISILTKLFDDIKTKYEDTNFFNLNYNGIYDKEISNANLLIELEPTDSVFELKSNQIMKNFKIYNIEYNIDKFDTKELLYEKKTINKDKLILIKRVLAEGSPNFKISWDTPYNYHIEIIPTYNGKDGGINLIKTIKELTN